MFYWMDAFATAVFLLDRLPSKALANHLTPYEKFYGVQPNYSILLVFGCICYPYARPYNAHKLEFRLVACIFLGYSFQHQGYKCIDLTTGRIYISRHVRFDESKFHVNGTQYNFKATTALKSSLNPSDISSLQPHSCRPTQPSPSPNQSSSLIPSSIPTSIPTSPSLLPTSIPISPSLSHTLISSNSSSPHPSPIASVSSPPYLTTNTPFLTHNIYPMITRNKEGIHKHKVYSVSADIIPPTTIDEALADPA